MKQITRGVTTLILLIVLLLFSGSVKPFADASYLRDIYYAGGCFWGVEDFFAHLEGVYDTEAGYANGDIDNPTYEMICSGNTGYAETVRVQYDSRVLDLEELTRQFLGTLGPEDLAGVNTGNKGQYRLGIYYTEEPDRERIEKVLNGFKPKNEAVTGVEVLPLVHFYQAEDYHQNHLERIGGSCGNDSSKSGLLAGKDDTLFQFH